MAAPKGKPAAETPAKGTAIAVPANTGAIALPEDMSWVAEQNDEFTRDDVNIPFLRVLQDLSPQVKRRDPAYIEGAEPGMIYSAATAEVYNGEEGVVVVPVKYDRSVTEWVPRAAGGGFVADHGNDLSVLQRAERTDKGLVLPNGNELLDAALYYALLLRADGGVDQVVVQMSGFGWKAARPWNTRMSNLKVADPQTGRPMANPPIFVGAWTLRTQPDSNDKGDFFRWALPEFKGWTWALPDGPAIMEGIKHLRAKIASGAVKADVSKARDVEEGAARPAAGGAGGGTGEDDIPF